MTCSHERLKKVFRFGTNSKPLFVCKDCGNPIRMCDLHRKKRRR